MTDKTIELRRMIQQGRYLVVKDNAFVQNTYCSLNHTQSMALDYLISMIQPGDQPGKWYTFDCEEFCAILRWTTPRYSTVKTAVRELQTKQWWILTDSGLQRNVGFLAEVRAERQQRYMQVQFSPACADYLFGIRQKSDRYKKYLLDLQEEREDGTPVTMEEPDPAYYTAYTMETLACLKHRYAPRLYELLKSHANKSAWTFEIGTGSRLDLQPMLNVCDLNPDQTFVVPTAWHNWACFYRDVLEDAMADINRFTDLTVTCSGHYRDFSYRRTRGIRSATFHIRRKTEDELYEVHQCIRAAYESYLEERVRKDADRTRARIVARKEKQAAQREADYAALYPVNEAAFLGQPGDYERSLESFADSFYGRPEDDAVPAYHEDAGGIWDDKGWMSSEFLKAQSSPDWAVNDELELDLDLPF